MRQAIDDLVDPSHTDAPEVRGLVRVTAPEAFVVEVVAPAVARATAKHAALACEMVSATRPTPQHGPSTDLDVGVTRPQSPRVRTREIATYDLGLFASPDYLARAPVVRARQYLQSHELVYYVKSMLQLSDLDLLDELFPHRDPVLGATSVHAQIALVASGGGIGLLPGYVAARNPGLLPVLDGEAVATLTYWMTGRPDNLGRPEVAAIAEAIMEEACGIAIDGFRLAAVPLLAD